jgi:hypothetical protein
MPTGNPPAASAGPRRNAVNVPGITTMPSTRLWPSRTNLNWNIASSTRSRWNQLTTSVLGSSMAPTHPIRGSRNQGTA